VRSEPGKGTSLNIKLPLTLAIVPALIVASGGEQFAIPQANLIELVRLEADAARREIERIHGFPVYRRRGNLLPLIELNAELDLKSKSDGSLSIVVLQSDGDQFGVVVDQIYDTEEIVVKPLGPQLKGHPCFSGATILGSGHVALILDAWGLAKRAGSTADEDSRSAVAHDFGPLAAAHEATESWLLFRVGTSGLMALPMSGISRLEKLEVKKVERSGHNEVIQYRGQIMPLVRIATALGMESAEADPKSLQVIVYPKSGRDVGLVVDEILDIVQGQSILDTRHVQHGVAGCAVIKDRVADLLNVDELLAAWDVAPKLTAVAA
jgi:two-component system chemotaxis sensor kinase CheA